MAGVLIKYFRNIDKSLAARQRIFNKISGSNKIRTQQALSTDLQQVNCTYLQASSVNSPQSTKNQVLCDDIFNNIDKERVNSDINNKKTNI